MQKRKKNILFAEIIINVIEFVNVYKIGRFVDEKL